MEQQYSIVHFEVSLYGMKMYEEKKIVNTLGRLDISIFASKGFALISKRIRIAFQMLKINEEL